MDQKDELLALINRLNDLFRKNSRLELDVKEQRRELHKLSEEVIRLNVATITTSSRGKTKRS